MRPFSSELLVLNARSDDKKKEADKKKPKKGDTGTTCNGAYCQEADTCTNTTATDDRKKKKMVLDEDLDALLQQLHDLTPVA